VEGLLVEELDGAQGNRDRTGGCFLFIGEVEKVLPQFFVADLVRRLAVVLGQLANSCLDELRVHRKYSRRGIRGKLARS
jgi:hypothetical protein